MLTPGPAKARAQSTAERIPIPAWQTAAGGKMSFDVASIHLAKPGTFRSPNFALDTDNQPIPPGGRFFADFPLAVYITFAYKMWLTGDQLHAMLAGQPEWTRTDQFVIEAQADGNPTKDQMRLMVQSLLADRFKLKVHRATSVEPVYALVLAKPGKLGPKLIPHSEGPPCGKATAPSGDAGKQERVFPPDCNLFEAEAKANHTILLGSRGATMQQIGDSFPGIGRLGRPVVDETGLKGTYDFTIEFTRDVDPPAANAGAQLDLGAPPLLVALKDQLGLKLRATRAPVETLVIDRVEPPSPN
jgi:bla regulator protein blaR1